ncbi:MAG: serine hydrolase [Rhizomicrobium sp.]
MSNGEVSTPFIVHSIRKSFASALFGMATARGEIELNASLAALQLDDIPALTEAEKQATVRDLLEARSGVFLLSAIDAQRPARGSADDQARIKPI